MQAHPTLSLNDGCSIPQFGLGVWRVADQDAESIVTAALRCGYRAVDTAAAYGNEGGVGAALRSGIVPRDQVAVTTKLPNDHHGYDAAMRAIDASLARLGLDMVDLYLIHWPQPGRGLFVETWRALIKMRQDGRARSIGVSNFTAPILQRVIDETGVVPSVNQVELHPDFQQRALREFHASYGIVTESWSPLGRGKALDNPVLAGIARKHGKTAAQVVIRWHIDSGLMVIPKSATPARIAENVDVFDFALDDDDLGAIASLDDPAGRMGPDPQTFG
jgi:2,5-diketo-D-gluconate reductase A